MTTISSSRVSVISREGCQQCRATLRALDARDIDYDLYDIAEHPDLADHAHELGFTQAPIVIAPGMNPWSGFRPDLIDTVAR